MKHTLAIVVAAFLLASGLVAQSGQSAPPEEFKDMWFFSADFGAGLAQGNLSTGTLTAPMFILAPSFIFYPFNAMWGLEIMMGGGTFGEEDIMLMGFGTAISSFNPLKSHVVWGGGVSVFPEPATILYIFGRVGYSVYLGPSKPSATLFQLRLYGDLGYAFNTEAPQDSGFVIKPTLAVLIVRALVAGND